MVPQPGVSFDVGPIENAKGVRMAYDLTSQRERSTKKRDSPEISEA